MTDKKEDNKKQNKNMLVKKNVKKKTVGQGKSLIR